MRKLHCLGRGVVVLINELLHVDHQVVHRHLGERLQLLQGLQSGAAGFFQATDANTVDNDEQTAGRLADDLDSGDKSLPALRNEKRIGPAARSGLL